MNSPLSLLLLFSTAGLHAILAADPDQPAPPPSATADVAKVQLVRVRLRFVPGSPTRPGNSDFKGASFMKLCPGPGKGTLWCQAHAGVGDRYPVTDEAGVNRFDVLLADGDDDHVILEISSREGVKRIELARDKPGALELAGIKYELLYPSVSVGGMPDEKATTNKAMLIVTQRL